MTVKEVLDQLHALSDPRAVKNWERIGNDPKNYIGVALTKLKNLAKKIKKNHELSLELWKTGIHDARVLACLIADPLKVTEAQIDEWMKQIENTELGDQIANYVVTGGPFAMKKMKQWTKSKDEWTKRTGYMLVAAMAGHPQILSEEDLEKILETIEKEIHRSPNYARDGMNWALIKIGYRSPELNKLAQAAAKRIGPVMVDYGDTSCKVPDALTYLQRK
jgi:3-methyladenine DNA glycosylase AlkD